MTGANLLTWPVLVPLVGAILTLILARCRLSYGYAGLLLVILASAALIQPVILAVFAGCLLAAHIFARLGGARVRTVPMWLCGEEHQYEEVTRR